MIDQIRNSVRNIKNNAQKMNQVIKLGNQQSEDMYKKYSESNSLIN